MSLVADYSSSSCSSEDEDQEEFPDGDDRKFRETPKPALPRADILLSSGKPGEVFANPYKEAENAKIASLEKHVKMVDTEDHTKTKNGKKICWNYRKGRCRFGSNCTFAHDSDLHITATQNAEETKQNQNIPKTSVVSKPHGQQISSSSGKATDSNKRNRVSLGLSDSVVPSKKIMKQYRKNKKQNT